MTLQHGMLNPELKWKELANWCETFRKNEGRAPTVWLDKLCIDQQNIIANAYSKGIDFSLSLSTKIEF